MRQLASIRTITNVTPIPDADKIECYWIDGWSVVDQKGKYREGDTVIFLEIDSWVPDTLAPFLSKGKVPRVYMDVRGERLKSVRLRGQLSQGLILPISVLDGKEWIEDDLAATLNINKWEIPEVSSGLARGNWPYLIAHTDQERIQNLLNDVFNERYNEAWEITTKLDGSSMTMYHINGEVGVCSRKVNLRLDQEGNHFITMANRLGVLDKMKEDGLNIAIQGEIIGPGIQGNKEDLLAHDFFVFDVWNCDKQKMYDHYDRMHLVAKYRLNTVPIVARNVSIPGLGCSDLQDLLSFAEGPSLNNSVREGVVFKQMDGSFSFKVISNEFLLKYGG